jgi:hypothetical protein
MKAENIAMSMALYDVLQLMELIRENENANLRLSICNLTYIAKI